ncbi:MAG: UDP-N-acetylmuramoyl-tripeptide--D-alanyl-D-alanine ligase [Pirellulales bacterium]
MKINQSMNAPLQLVGSHPGELSLAEVARATGGHLRLGAMPPLDGADGLLGPVVIDSRRVTPHEVFWALPGSHFHGADFVEEAFAHGASGVVTPRFVEPWAGRWALQVPDPQLALWQTAATVRRRFVGLVAGVTGSVGKTTTRQMIHAVLSQRYAGTASPENFNNHLGLPLSMLRWRSSDDYAVLELGANHRGEIAGLTELAKPRMGVICPLAEAHLGEFGSLRAIAESKAELLEALPRDGLAVVYGDDPELRRVAACCRAELIWVGRGSECDFTATHVHSSGGCLQFRVQGFPISVPVAGRHHLIAALSAFAVGHVLGVSREQIAEALGRFELPGQRCRTVRVGDAWIIDDTYNACPSAMQAALELLRDFNAPGRRIAVCGDMAELGPDAPWWHRRLGEQIVSVCGADRLIACGQYSRHVASSAIAAGMPERWVTACRTTEEATARLATQLAAGDVALVKGARRMQMERIVHAVAAPGWVARAAA